VRDICVRVRLTLVILSTDFTNGRDLDRICLDQELFLYFAWFLIVFWVLVLTRIGYLSIVNVIF